MQDISRTTSLLSLPLNSDKINENTANKTTKQYGLFMNRQYKGSLHLTADVQRTTSRSILKHDEQDMACYWVLPPLFLRFALDLLFCGLASEASPV